MPEANAEPLQRSATNSHSHSTNRSPDPPLSAAAHDRAPQRRSSRQNVSFSPKPSPIRRRSSLLSFSSIDDVTQSLAEDLINPSMKRPRSARQDDEVTHWHSTPLAFAILPAVGGLLFKNGSAFTTDALLLLLAAIFLNWSVRLPWDWYYSAQAQRRVGDLDDGDFALDDIEIDEAAVESSSSAEDPLKHPAPQNPASEFGPVTTEASRREDAAAQLRRQERLALCATFICPVAAAYLLHVIRAQLSRPSTGLVSDYNISIFLLAAEIRPFRQLLRLITSRTIHLQRTVTGLNDPFGAAIEEKAVMGTLASRVVELEAKLTDHTIVPSNVSIAQKHDIADLSAELRKRYEPRLEGLERAVRRYEKRSTTFGLLAEQRLNSLESRLQDALSLAAIAAQQSQKRGVVATALERLSTLIAIPLKIAWGVLVWPVYALEEAYKKFKAILLGPPTSRPPKRSSSRHGGARDEKTKEKGPVRRVAR
ncbi:hypothetical protein LTR37_020988 [Vermiconidia calcicola]|uniref:Uncharacterized protein n=1 Tax=Vermiconidia calcicola TaxID=1690605 RepID=A0ACC3M9W8_9PEZI|nr:hypothetical protein LTR37_020988 [Vermiconidia calcicola]